MHRIDAVIEILARAGAVAHGAERIQGGAGGGGEIGALGVAGALGDDVDDAVDGIRAPEGSAGTADDLDAVDVLEQGVLDVPEDAGEERGVDRTAVDHDQELVGKVAVEPARPDDPAVGVELGRLQVWRQPQSLGQVRGGRAADVLAGDHLDGGGDLREFLGAPGDGRDLEVHEFFEAELLQGLDRGDVAVRRGRSLERSQAGEKSGYQQPKHAGGKQRNHGPAGEIRICQPRLPPRLLWWWWHQAIFRSIFKSEKGIQTVCNG